MVKIYEVAYSEHTVHHKRFEAASQDEAIAMASKDVEKQVSSFKRQASSSEHFRTRLPLL
jgi:hypothetical protein